MTMMGHVLFHGRAAHEAALRISPNSIFDRGISAEEIRSGLEELRGVLVGDSGVQGIFGPLDDSSKIASDALLKSLEDLSPERRIVLWARDESHVRDTILSRVVSVYCPPLDTLATEGEDYSDLLEAISRKDIPGILERVASIEDFSGMVEALSRDFDPRLWSELRKGLSDPKFDRDDFLAVVLGVVTA